MVWIGLSNLIFQMASQATQLKLIKSLCIFTFDLHFPNHFSFYKNAKKVKPVHFLVVKYKQVVNSMLFYICFGRHSTFQFHCWHQQEEVAAVEVTMFQSTHRFVSVFYIWIHTILSAMAICRSVHMPSL